MLRIALIISSTLLTGFLLNTGDGEISTPAHAYPEQLPGKYTGGFGEESCHSCHFDYSLNPEEGSLNTEGIPSSYDPGEMYTFTIEVSRKDLDKAGFQLTARYADSTQAGSFSVESDRIEFTNSTGDVQYVQHSPEGTEPNESDISIWSLKWAAPEQSKGNIIFSLAANAANGDASEFGDFIFIREIVSSPQAGN